MTTETKPAVGYFEVEIERIDRAIRAYEDLIKQDEGTLADHKAGLDNLVVQARHLKRLADMERSDPTIKQLLTEIETLRAEQRATHPW